MKLIVAFDEGMKVQRKIGSALNELRQIYVAFWVDLSFCNAWRSVHAKIFGNIINEFRAAFCFNSWKLGREVDCMQGSWVCVAVYGFYCKVRFLYVNVNTHQQIDELHIDIYVCIYFQNKFWWHHFTHDGVLEALTLDWLFANCSCCCYFIILRWRKFSQAVFVYKRINCMCARSLLWIEQSCKIKFDDCVCISNLCEFYGAHMLSIQSCRTMCIYEKGVRYEQVSTMPSYFVTSRNENWLKNGNWAPIKWDTNYSMTFPVSSPKKTVYAHRILCFFYTNRCN